jgi:kynureninase
MIAAGCNYRIFCVLTAAPVPLYNSFEDVALFVERLGEALVGLAARGA